MGAFTIERITTTRLDIPLRTPITMSFGKLVTENVILVRMQDSAGVTGVGEAAILGGPYWSEESAESVLATVNTYLAPALVGQRFDSLPGLAARLERLVRGNPVARSAVEGAALDMVAKSLGRRAVDLIGTPHRHEIPVAWTLSEGCTEADIDAGERAIAERGHRMFKLKFGHAAPEDDLRRAARIVAAFEGRAQVTADVNQGWDEATARRCMSALKDAGLTALEQPLPADDHAGIARLIAETGLDVIADEAVLGPRAARRLAEAGAATVLSMKPGRDGGLMASRGVARVAEEAGLGLYGGSMLETSVGTALSAHLFAALPCLAFGSELFGPLRLAEDIVETPLSVSGGVMRLPEGPGSGVTLDEDKVAFLADPDSAARTYLMATP